MTLESAASQQDAWDDSIVRSISQNTSIEVVGTFERGGHTCFARVRTAARTADGGPTSLAPPLMLRDIVGHASSMLSECRNETTTTTQGAPSLLDANNKGDNLIQIGAVWILRSSRVAVSNESNAKNKRTTKGRNAKGPTRPCSRATVSEATYAPPSWDGIIVRIHHGALRFPDVYNYDWGKMCRAGTTVLIRGEVVSLPSKGDDLVGCSSKQGVIIYEDIQRGYAIINKPQRVPVHGMVYNGVENVAYMYQQAWEERMCTTAEKISLPQRLDNNTSGVLVVATSSSFASYMCKLLEAKTTMSEPRAALVSNRYKCLVCVKKGTGDSLSRLARLADTGEIVTHYLSSARTLPRIFRKVPTNQDGTWLECRLRIVSIGFGDRRPIVLSTEPEKDRRRLWGSNGVDGVSSDDCVAVTQVEVDLLTGRTHQIRGQLAELGFPLVGDSLYGGGAGDKMALHCCQLSFPDPDISFVQTKRGKLQMTPSTKFNTFRCDVAWWNSFFS